MKGFVFSMDAILGLLIVITMASTFIMMLEAESQQSSSSEKTLALSRLARDLAEVRKKDPSYAVPSWLKTGGQCDGAQDVGSSLYFRINPNTGSLDETTVRVCFNG